MNNNQLIKVDHTSSSVTNTNITSSTRSTSNSYEVPRNRCLIQNYRLIWLDTNIDALNDEFSRLIIQLKGHINTIDTFTDIDQCFDFLTDIIEDKVLMIISSALGQLVIPFIHDISQINAIFIFPGNSVDDQLWNKDWSKIVGVFTELDSMNDSLKEAIRQCDHNTTSISFVSIDDVSNTNLDELDKSFMYTQLLKEILFEINYNEQSLKDFVIYCSNIFADNDPVINKISRFEREYSLKSPIWWYTFENFIYSVLNRALRTQEMNTLIKMGFFIYGLHQQIKELHETQFDNKDTSLTVYRGQSLSKNDFEKLIKSKGGLIAFNNFLSTSEDRQVAYTFAESNGNDCDSIGILFEITINTGISTSPFARIDQFTNYDSEKEILFSMHTVFRIGDIKMCKDAKNIWIVELKVTSDNDPLLKTLTERFRHETKDTTGWYRLARLLMKLGQRNKAEEIYRVLLDQYTSDDDNDEKALLLDHLGSIKREQGDYVEATTFYDRSLQILKRIFPQYHPRIIHAYSNFGVLLMDMGNYSLALSVFEATLDFQEKMLRPDHSDLIATYANIGHIHSEMNDYSKALSAYEKVLETYEKTLPSNHPDLATYYNIIGGVYDKMGEYSQALSLHKKALAIRQKILPPDHPELAASFHSIACSYQNMGEYSKALSYLETALEILRMNPSSNCHDLATLYHNIGSVHENMSQYLKALSFYNKALDMHQKNLPPEHPQLAHCYNSIGRTYHSMSEYSNGLSYLEKALTIFQKILPSDNLIIAACYNDIGNIQKSLGHYSEALSFCEKALDICEKTLPPNHFVLLTSYHNIGKVCQIMHDYSKAMAFYQKALQIQEKTLASNHPDLAHVYGNIAQLCMETNDYSKALTFYEKALEIQQKNLPPDHLELAMTYNGIGTAYKNMNQPLKAIPFLQRFLAIAQPQLNRSQFGS